MGVLEGLEKVECVWMSHSNTVYELPFGFEVLADTNNASIATFRSGQRLFGLQWHAEVFHTEKGDQMLRNFIFLVCGCKTNWNMGSFIDQAIAGLKRMINNKRCIVVLSGGVDSTTVVALAAKAVRERLIAVL